MPGQSVTLLVIPPKSNLSLSPGAPRTDGKFQFSVLGEIAETFVLQSSTNLAAWSPVSTNTFGGSQMQFILPASSSRQFYRAVLTAL